MSGGMAEDEFIKFRLRQGVYGQRQPDVQMIRVKLPFGGITPEQLEAFASVIDQYVPLRKGHLTTRQNIQMHHIPLPEMEPVMRELAEAGLSSREGCGNTVRNVTADPWAGVASDEIFDITPYAAAYVRYFVRHPTTQAMPRKVKTAFDGSPEDRAICAIHDIAFRARVREIEGRGEVRGAQLLVGGGTSIMPREAQELYDFVEFDNGEYLRIAEAVFRIFDRQEWLRANRARARIKVFVDKYGIDELRRQVEEELRGDWVAERDFSIDKLLFVDDEQAAAPAAPADAGAPNGDLREFERFAASSVRPQRQEGFVTVEVRIVRGDLTPEQLRGLAAVVREYSGGYARTTVNQNLVLRWVREESAYDVYRALERARPRRRRGARGDGRRLLPRNRLLQARHHELDGPERGGPGAPGGDGDHRPADPHDADPHERLPERLLPAPRRGHRLLRRVDQGRRAHDPRLHPPRRRRSARRQSHFRHPPEGAAARKARPRGRRTLASPLRGDAQRGRELAGIRAARGNRAARRGRLGPHAADRVRPANDGQFHRLESTSTIQSRQRRGRVRSLTPDHSQASSRSGDEPRGDATHVDAATDAALSLTHTLREAARHGSGAVLLCSFQKEESVLIDELLRLDQGTGRAVRIVTIDTGVLFPETLATWREFEEHFGVTIEVEDASNRENPWTGA